MKNQDQILVATKNEKIIMKNKGNLADVDIKDFLHQQSLKETYVHTYDAKVFVLLAVYTSYFANTSNNVNGEGSKMMNLLINAFSCYVGLDRC